MAAHLPPNGTICRARRAGWNEKLTPEQEWDLDPVEDVDAVLTGPLLVVMSDAPETGPLTTVLVGGQIADPATVKAV